MPITRHTSTPENWTKSGSSAASISMTFTPTPEIQYRETMGTRYRELLAWANNNGYKLVPFDYVQILWSETIRIYLWGVFDLVKDEHATTHNARLFVESRCATTGCKHDLQVGDIICAADHAQFCTECGLAGLRIYRLDEYPNSYYCAACLTECSVVGCTNTLLTSGGFKKCSTCDPRKSCEHCGRVVALSKIKEHVDNANRKRSLCEACLETACDECRKFGLVCSVVEYERKKHRLCKNCASAVYDKKRESLEVWPASEIPISGNLLIPSTAHRPIRTISIETEFDGDGPAVGRALYKAGLLDGAEIGRTHTAQGTKDSRSPCLLKRDGSVTGGELVTYLLQLDDENHAAALMRMTEVMRGCREVGFAQFTHRAGGHIHQDLHGFDMTDLWVYYTLFKFLEAPIFYLAGAGAPYGHRSLSGSNNYTPPPSRGPFGDVKEFAAKRDSGRTAFNIGNFTYSMTECKCGAYLAGKMKECNCNLGKATVEWRVWNAEISPRILHAWLALMQSLAAYALDMEKFKESEYTYLPWRTVQFKDLKSTEAAAIKARLEWMHRQLPLTLHERDSLIYACKKSQLGKLGDDYLDGLIDIEAKHAVVKKAPPNPNRRKEKLLVATNKKTKSDIEFFVHDDLEF